MAIPLPVTPAPIEEPAARPIALTAGLPIPAGDSASYGFGGAVAGGGTLAITDLSGFAWWTSPRIDDPVRVRLSENLNGIFVDARLELAFFANIDLPLGSTYRIGDELSTAVDLYNFTVAGKNELGGLNTYEGETLLSRLSRVVAEGSLVLLPGVGDTPDPLTPAFALERLLEHYGIPHAPIPDLLIRLPDDTLNLHLQAFVFEARPEDRATLLQLLEEFLAPFDGYRIRATASNELDIAAPGWADPLADTLLLTQADLAPEGSTSQRTADIVNACEVTVQGFEFLEDQPLMEPATAIVRGGSSTRQRTLGAPIPVPAIANPTEPVSGYVDILDVTLPHVSNAASGNGANPYVWRSVVWPLADGVTAQPGSPVTVDLQLNIHRLIFRGAPGSNPDPEIEDVQTINVTEEIPIYGPDEVGRITTIWQGYYPHHTGNGDGGERGRGIIQGRWDASQFGGRGGIILDIGHQAFGNTWAELLNWWHVFGLELLLNGTGTTWGRSEKREVHRFGYTQADRDLVPGLNESVELYELREKRIDMGWFSIEPEDALAVARAVVEANYNPKVVHQLQVVPNGADGYRARPWHLGRPAQLPDGSLGRLTSWSYEEAHTPAASASSVSIEVEAVQRLAADRAGRTHFGRATYRVGKYRS